jgi:uncharacterized protein
LPTRSTAPRWFFEQMNPSAATAFAENDPYVRAGLVKNWRVRAWNVVIGG